VWGLKDNRFDVQWAEWLDKNLLGSRRVRKVEDANLFFPEEMPDLIADEYTGESSRSQRSNNLRLVRFCTAAKGYSRSSTSPRPTS
jgi:hypothetical protein